MKRRIALLLAFFLAFTTSTAYAEEVNTFTSVSQITSVYDLLDASVPKPTYPNYNGPYFTRNLVANNLDIDVYSLTTALNYLRYETPITYSYNDSVKKAVIAFQTDNHITTNGQFTKATRTAMESTLKDMNIGLPRATEQLVVNAPPTTGTWIFIDKSSNLLYHMSGSSLIKKYGVATGSQPTLTPEGKFKIILKAVNPSWGGDGYAQPVAGGDPSNPLGFRWMGLDKGGGGNYGIHGTTAPSSIGTYASHGCVRMQNTDVEYIFDIIPNKTPVWIGFKPLLNEFGIHFNYTVDGKVISL